MDIQTLTLLLTNPLSFGGLISWVLEQLAFFKDEEQSPAVKIAVVLGICQLWAIVAFILNDTGAPLTVAVARTVIYNGLAVAVGSQVFHALINKWIPGLMDFALTLRSGPPKTIERTSVSTEGFSQSKTVEKNTLPPVGPPEPMITPPPAESEIVLPPPPDPLYTPSMQSATDTLARAGQDDWPFNIPPDSAAKG